MTYLVKGSEPCPAYATGREEGASLYEGSSDEGCSDEECWSPHAVTICVKEVSASLYVELKSCPGICTCMMLSCPSVESL